MFVDESQETIVLFSKATEHANCPKKAKAFRVENYWSVMTMKPFTTSDQPGVEFSLTGFENPGLSLPSYITSWIAIQAMPEFFSNLRKTCLDRRKWKSTGSSQGKSGSNSSQQQPSYLETPSHYSSQTSHQNYA